MHASGRSRFITPSEDGCALIREDMDRVEHHKYAMPSLLNAQEEIQPGEIQPLSALDALDAELATNSDISTRNNFCVIVK